MKAGLDLLVGAVLALTALSAAVAVPDPAVAADEPVVIGAVFNLTGGQKDLGLPSSEGARLAVDLANAGKGVLGRKVRMVVIDGGTDPMTISRQARRFFDDEPSVAGMIGLSDTDMVLAAAPVAAEHGRVFVTSGATSPLLPSQVPDFLFLACFGDNVQAAAGAEWAYVDLGARTVAVLHKQGNSYTRLLHGYFEARFEELGGQVLASRPYALEDFDASVRALPKADLIYLAATPDDVAAAIPKLRAAGIAAPILGGDGLDIGAAWGEVASAKDVFFTTHAYVGADNPDPAVQEFRTAFAKAYGDREPNAFTALGYDTARLLMVAIEAAGSTEPEAVRNAVAATTDFAGVTGKISFAKGSQIPLKPVTIMEVNGGRQSFRANVLPKQVPPP
jgi:branched-chain amino acid transport system substrate-binding protein